MKNVPTISVQQSLLRTLMEAQGFVHDIEQVNDELPLLGTDIDACTEEQLDIEIFPDRPDLLSGETLAFAMANFLHGAPARPDMMQRKFQQAASPNDLYIHDVGRLKRMPPT